MDFMGSGGNPQYFNRYAYTFNDPVNNLDPDGNVVETVWDAGNVVVGVASLGYNLKEGNYGSAALDALGVVVDGAATVVPFVPGGAAAGIKAGRAAKVLGNAQETEKAGELTTHGSTSQRIANEMAESGEYVSVHMNQTVKTITGGDVPSKVRPDVAGVKPDGTVDAVEVLSPKQTSQQMTDKLQNALGDRCGGVSCVAPD